MKSKGKYSLNDFTFLIPLRVDGMVRLENLLMSIRYLLMNFDTNITVLQASAYENGIVPRMLGKKVNYQFIEDHDTVFYRTKYLNKMTREATTPYVGIWDTDIIIPREQIIDSVQRLHEGYEIVYPYDGHFYDTTEIIRELFLNTKKIDTLIRNQAKMRLIYGNESKGGAMFVNRCAYMLAGMENEKFYGWGPEDGERYVRWELFEYKIYHTKGELYHLTHGRGSNSKFRSLQQMMDSNKEFKLTSMSNKDEIIRETENYQINDK